MCLEGRECVDLEAKSFRYSYNYFYKQNEAIANGTVNGTHLEMNSLTIINGIIDEAIQVGYYPKFANNNT
jgi:hypothetical protein